MMTWGKMIERAQRVESSDGRHPSHRREIADLWLICSGLTRENKRLAKKVIELEKRPVQVVSEPCLCERRYR